MKTLRISAGTIRFDAPDSLQTHKGVRSEPLLRPLRRKRFQNVFGLLLARRAVQPDKQIGSAQVTIVLGNLVFQDQMAAKGVPSQFTDHPVILMQVVAAVRQNQVRRELLLQLLEFTLDLRWLRREKTVSITANHDFLFLRGRQE